MLNYAFKDSITMDLHGSTVQVYKIPWYSCRWLIVEQDLGTSHTSYEANIHVNEFL